jgi:hypothetical protein
MRFQSIFAAATFFLEVAYSAPSEFVARAGDIHQGMPSSDKVIEMQKVGDGNYQRQWAAFYEAPEDGLAGIKDLYIVASGAFNWVRKQTNCLSGGGNALLAAYFDKRTNDIVLATIPREDIVRDELINGGHAPVWKAHWKKVSGRDVHAEDLAYVYNEMHSPIDPGGTTPEDYKYGDGTEGDSMVAVWGVKGSNVNDVKEVKGDPWAQCDPCGRTAESLGVYIEPPA